MKKNIKGALRAWDYFPLSRSTLMECDFFNPVLGM